MTSLSNWLKNHTPQEREQLAESAKTSVAYLYQLAGKHRTPSLSLALRIKEGTSGFVTPESFYSLSDSVAA